MLPSPRPSCATCALLICWTECRLVTWPISWPSTVASSASSLMAVMRPAGHVDEPARQREGVDRGVVHHVELPGQIGPLGRLGHLACRCPTRRPAPADRRSSRCSGPPAARPPCPSAISCDSETRDNSFLPVTGLRAQPLGTSGETQQSPAATRSERERDGAIMDVPRFAFDHGTDRTNMYTKKATGAVIPVAVPPPAMNVTAP